VRIRRYRRPKLTRADWHCAKWLIPRAVAPRLAVPLPRRPQALPISPEKLPPHAGRPLRSGGSYPAGAGAQAAAPSPLPKPSISVISPVAASSTPCAGFKRESMGAGRAQSRRFIHARTRPTISDDVTKPMHAATASMTRSLRRACRPGTNNCAISMMPEAITRKTASKSCLRL
jgi:hypothetical protein